ncbi:MAG: YezD family protein [Planctomycetes bacterium]|nr:YezD family protein [Planctomycetota bacterium]
MIESTTSESRDDDSVQTTEVIVPGRQQGELSTQLRRALAGLKYGQIVLFVQSGEVVRIERTDRCRCFNKRLAEPKSDRQSE